MSQQFFTVSIVTLTLTSCLLLWQACSLAQAHIDIDPPSSKNSSSSDLWSNSIFNFENPNNNPNLELELAEQDQELTEELLAPPTQVSSKGRHTPSDTCKLIVHDFGRAVSHFTLCSVTNARPIHLCQLCIGEYSQILSSHQTFLNTIDEYSNPCQEYFINLDRLQIVSEAFKYVRHLWKEANCNHCFETFPNGSLSSEPTALTVRFNEAYNQTIRCFEESKPVRNETCNICSDDYRALSDVYVEISDGRLGGAEVCMDIVDTMNITREIWSNTYKCIKHQKIDIGLQIGLLAVATVLPILFYLFAYFLSHKQEARVFKQKRLAAEVFAVNSSGSFGDGRFGGASQSSSSGGLGGAGFIPPRHRIVVPGSRDREF